MTAITLNKKNIEASSLRISVIKATADLINHNKAQASPNLYQSLLNIIEPTLLESLMMNFRYNQSHVARLMGLSRGTLHGILLRLGLSKTLLI